MKEVETPTPETGETTTQNADIDESDTVDREAAVNALRDVLRFYRARLNDEITDHTEAGEHPERPTTARDYFTDVRGWDGDTVENLLLGWAPADHVDQLVAYLHDRGHSREAMLATGAIGESETGSLYATFSGRYVLPYYDDGGEPAYAIARCTGGSGGGARGYGGHPDDHQAGKYSKLRHTDDRVPFEEPIYGLDTLADGDHVVVAEGIADAITARETGYAVLSPVAKEFKESHYEPLVDALDEYNIERVTIVADADNTHNNGAEEPKSIADAVGRTLSPVGAGLAGALRTATKLAERTEADLRVALPPAPADLENDLDKFVTGAWRGDLDVLLRSAKPAKAFPELAKANAGRTESSSAHDEFNAAEYEPLATSAEETTDDIRDLFAALDRLDAQRVAEQTIVAEWLEDRTSNRAFRPTWAPSDYTGTANYVDVDKWIDTGDRGGKGGPAVMAAIDAGLVSDTQCPEAVSGETWFKAVDHLRELGFSIPELETTTDEVITYRTDPRDRTATVDVRRAWKAASLVTPDDVPAVGLDATDDREAWLTASGERVGDVVRAVALDAGMIDRAAADIDDYPAAYNRAREECDAPIPRYYTTADAVAEFDAVLDVIAETTFFDLDAEALNSEITGEDEAVDGDAVRMLNPAWRDSKSGESVLVFESGKVWDADSDRVIDTLRFVALDAGIIDAPGDALEGEHFTEAYRRVRTEYGAPLPRWEPAEDGSREVTPQLPAAEELVEAFDYEAGIDTDALDDARADVEDLLGELTADGGDPTVITSLPATGKTTGTIKTAQERPLTYLASRKELQRQALNKADEWGVPAEILPVYCDENVRSEMLKAAIEHVRARGKDRLRNRWGVLTAALEATGDDGSATDFDAEDLFVDDQGEEEINLDRPTCETARGEHGPAWALAVHVARALGYTPREIHQHADGLFGASLPCNAGTATCEYTDGWDTVGDADDCPELLVGSNVHAHVESARTYYDRGPQDEVEHSPRAVVLDEFPDDAFVREFEEVATDYATWLARSLVDRVEDRKDMRTAELHSDEWVTAWLNGRGDEVAEETVDTLHRVGKWFDAREAAREIVEEVDSDVLDALDLESPLGRVADGEAVAVVDDLGDAIASVDPNQPAAGVARWADESVAAPLTTATSLGGTEPSVDAINTDEIPENGDLRGLVDRAIEAVEESRDDARAAVEAAAAALRGGREGCRQLAAWADDGYAHPDAYHLFQADITPTADRENLDEDDLVGGQRLSMDSSAFDDNATEGTVVDRVETGEKSTVVADRNDHGALLHTPPTRQSAGGGEVPLVGLDATGRGELWSVALGERVDTADIHTTPGERAAFLESALGLRVIRAADSPLPYEGDPGSKGTKKDVALLDNIADKYSGITAPRSRDGVVDTVGKPAAITTKDVREVLEADSRLDDVVAAWENYGNVTGANDLGEHRLAAILGSQHYGDDAVERFCALGGENVDTDRSGGRGGDLDYGSELANTYLKHMRDDQVMQAALRFARGGSPATVVARTSALRDDLPVVGRGQVVRTWSDTATAIARRWRRLGDRFTVADVADAVDVTKRHVRRELSEFAEAGYLRRVEAADGKATVYEAAGAGPTAGEVDLPTRDDAIDSQPGRTTHNEYYTWNVRVSTIDPDPLISDLPGSHSEVGAPPSPATADGLEPPS